jgi:hypothetical protein
LFVEFSDSQISILGSPHDLSMLAQRLAAPGENAAPLPARDYETRRTTRVRVDAVPQAGATISRVGDDLLFAGAEDDLAALGENIQTLADRPDGWGPHIHIEYYPDHPFLRPTSVPLVVELLEVSP